MTPQRQAIATLVYKNMNPIERLDLMNNIIQNSDNWNVLFHLMLKQVDAMLTSGDLILADYIKPKGRLEDGEQGG